DGLVFFPGGEQAEGDAPAKLRRALARRHRHLDVVGVDGVLAREVPDLEAQRIAADAGLDRPFDADLAPGPADQGLPCLPLLQHLQRAHRSSNPHAAGIPSVEPAAERQLVHGSVEAGLVVDLVGRQMGDDVLDAPAATVAGRRRLPRAKGAKLRPQSRDLAVVDGTGINASWVAGSCGWRWRVSHSVQAPVFIRITQEVAMLPGATVVRDIELGAVGTIGVQLYLLPPVFCNETPLAFAGVLLNDVQGSIELSGQIGRSKAAVCA